ncbi:MAG: phage terminase large subunit [Planctomycetia bacterium]|nr:phage terminase large subunit [Planctomycetia bacterium]
MTYTPTAKQRELQRLAKGKTRILAYGGSRSGKTFELCRMLFYSAVVTGGRYAILRKHYNAVKNSVLRDTFKTVLRVCFPGYPVSINESDLYCRFCSRNGSESEIWFIGLDDKDRTDRILGREFAGLYFNECSEISWHAVETALTRLSQKIYRSEGTTLPNKAFFDCNPTGKTHWAYQLFVEGVNPVSRNPVRNPDSYGWIRMNPQDNLANLPEGFIEDTLGSLSWRSRQRFLYGDWADENENALWKQESMIDRYRVRTVPDLERIVVGVDPAITSHEGSDLTGIVVAGKRRGISGEYEYWVLADRSISASPLEWSRQIIRAYREFRADRVVVEVNQGGDLVEQVLHRVDDTLPIKRVWATRGKIVRADPIAALYERGLVLHVGDLAELESEMTSFTGLDTEKSPDRMDAMVWAMTELSSLNTVEVGTFSFG